MMAEYNWIKALT